MKKSKFLVLAAMTALTLVGCGESGAKGNVLPSGGKEVDVSKEEGQNTLKQRLTNTVDAYAKLNLTSVGVKSVTSGAASFKANLVSESVGKINAELTLKDAGAQIEAKAAKATDGSVVASLQASTTSGSLSVKGSVEDPAAAGDAAKKASINQSLSLKGVEAAAYLSGNYVYADVSNKGIDTFLEGVDSFANGLIGSVKDTYVIGSILPLALSSLPEVIYTAEEGFAVKTAFDAVTSLTGRKFKVAVAPEAIAFPEIPENAAEGLSSSIDSVVNVISGLYAQNIGFSFKTFAKGGFGFELSLNKAKLLSLIEANVESGATTKEMLDKMVSKFNLEASVYFNDSCLLESIGLGFDCEAKFSIGDVYPDAAEAFSKADFSATASLNEKVTVSYNKATVTLPSDLADYTEVNLPSGEEEAE